MNKRKLSVSAILVAYNGATYLERALDCVYSQSRTPDEVILVDDGSTDNTAEVAKKYPSIRYVRQENAGPSSARNHGVRLAVGDTVCFLDVDDFWELDKLEREIGALESDDSIDIVQGKIVDVEANESHVVGEELELRVLAPAYHFVNLGSLSIRKSSFAKIGKFDEKRTQNEDTDWFLRAWEQNSNKLLLEDVSLYYSISEDSLSAGGSASAQSLPSLLRQHRDRAGSNSSIRPKVGLKDFFVGFPDRSKRKWNGNLVKFRFRDREKKMDFEDAVSKENMQIEQQFKLARVWKKRGRWKQALESYRRFVEKRPKHAIAHIEMGSVLEECGEPSDALDFYAKTLEAFPNEAELHKAYINLIDREQGLIEAFRLYDLKRLDNKELDLPEDALVCAFVCRNESQRLPYFLQYYREQGITHFFAIDNVSDDGSVDYLAEQDDVFLWQSGLSFNKANFGSVWFEIVLRSYALGRWCATVDVDELLYYPDCETVKLADYCSSLDKLGKRILPTVLLEMYSKGPVADALYSQGNPFLDTCPYFDSQFYHSRFERAGPFRNLTYFFGGARERVFGQNDAFCQSKVSLIKYDEDTILAGGQHWTNLPRDVVAESRGCLLHFKYFSDFAGKVTEEVKRKEHYQSGLQYQQYVSRLDSDAKGFTLYDVLHSVELTHSEQLIENGVMKRATEVEEQGQRGGLELPKISKFETKTVRPLLSVIVTVHDRVTHLPRCLESILCQAAVPEEMQIEVVADFVSPEKTEEIRDIVNEIGKGRVAFFPIQEKRGHPHIFNLCIERAIGDWVHIVHDDDWLAPGFYQSICRGIKTVPELGAAFSRYALMGKQGERKWTSFLEREHPGVIENWMDRIGVYCRLAFSSMVVKRSVFEELGGFSPSVGSAFDWDMWKRVAVNYPVWYEPEQLLFCGREGDSLTDGLMLNGQQIKDSLLSIELSKSYWPETSKTRIEESAREHYADYAVSLAKQQIELREYEAAFRNISSGLKTSRSKAIQSKLLRMLASVRWDT